MDFTNSEYNVERQRDGFDSLAKMLHITSVHALNGGVDVFPFIFFFLLV